MSKIAAVADKLPPVSKCTAEQIRALRRREFSVTGIARQLGLSEAHVAGVLKEVHLLAQISRETAKSGLGGGVVAKS